jgi:cytochrome c biogenesis protein CcmG/thiol:disulfide interchange protein DsbE
VRTLLVALVLIMSSIPVARGAVGDTSPDWTLETPDGTPVQLDAEVKRQATVLFFWATWCPYCKSLMTHLQSIRLEYGDNVRILAINILEDGDPEAAIRDTGFDFTLLPYGDIVAEQYGIFGVPALLILDKDRVIRFDLSAVHRLEPPSRGEPATNSRKAAYRAPHWAAEIRKSLDAVINTDYAEGHSR